MSYSAPASLNKISIHSFIAFVGAACTALRDVHRTIDNQIAITQLTTINSVILAFTPPPLGDSIFVTLSVDISYLSLVLL